MEVADAGNGGRMRRRMAGGFISARPASLIAGAVFRTPTAAPGADSTSPLLIGPTGRAMTTPSSDLVPTGFRIFDLTCDVIKSVFYGIFAVLQGHLRLWLVHRITWHRIQWPLVCYRVLPSF